MLTVYVFCAVIGGGLIVLSLFGGDHDHGGDVGHDADLSHDADLGHDADAGHEHDVSHEHDGGPFEGAWLLFVSLRFWTYLIAVFGVAGLLLTMLGETVEPVTGLLAGGTGFLSGLFASAIVQLVRRNEADSTAREKDFLGMRAKVTVPIREQQLGRIRTTVKGELIDVLARSEEPLALPEGSEVVIVGMEDGKATVMPLELLLEEKQ